MSLLHHKDDFLIAEYTLGLLDPDEVAQAHAVLGGDDDAVVCALQWEARLLELTDALTPLNPPAPLLGRIQATLGLPRSAPVQARPSAGTAASAPPATSGMRPAGAGQRPVPPVQRQAAPPPPPRVPAAPASSAQSGMAMDFEPRLIRPDAASTAQPGAASPHRSVADSAGGPAVNTPSAHTAPEASSSEPPRANHAASGPPRIRTAPPDPLEAFRPGAGSRRPPRQAIWRSLWFWRALSAALAILAGVLVLPKDTFKHDPALSASLQPPSTPAPKIVQIAIMQAPGLSSTPGWVLTVDSRQNLVLAPQVDIVVPESESVYLWTHNEQSPHPRLLGVVDPTRSLTLPMEVTGEIVPGQIFEMTQESNVAPPREPDGPILFIGRTVSLG
ncbi:anti-sigma factor domain-containing protein [Pusillimonas noertemannii]|uniref:anti-sigma factor domain-containing protein n=1 Tax=Pusillimonas noertemannii TaxID=305977 RepID=UPI0002D35D49|nr:anti-sigma factor [Pusillimonas noertemannii]